MSQALYRTYRPQSFKDIVGQNPIRITLENEIEHNRIAHAYLFSGPRGIGKTTTARLVAKAVNCAKRKGAEPCNVCEFCVEIAAGKSLDLIEIDAASHTGVDNVRENIIENARFTPQRAKYKVFIIDEVHMLSVSAFNALLKTLEEPPEHVIFILATTEIHRLPETIISRCQRFDFKRVGVADLIKRIQLLAKAEKITIDDAIVETIARRAEGSVRDAEVLLAQIMALGEKHITTETASLVIPRSNSALVLEFFGYLVHNDAPAAIILINKLIDEGVNVQDFTRDLIEFLRKVLLLKVSGSLDEIANLMLDEKTMESIRQQLVLVSVSSLVAMIELFSMRAREIKYAQITQLPLELAVLELRERAGGTPTVATAAPIGPKKKDNRDSSAQGGENDKPEAAKAKNKSGSVSFTVVKESWHKIIRELQRYNRSLALSFKVGCLHSVSDGILTIGFRYQFHADRIKDRAVRSKIEDVIENVLGTKLTVRTTMVTQEVFEQLTKDESVAASAVDENTVQDVLQAFGGEVVAEE